MTEKTIPDSIRRFVERSGSAIARRQKKDILKYISFEAFRAFVQSKGFHLWEVGNEFLIIRVSNLRFVC